MSSIVIPHRFNSHGQQTPSPMCRPTQQNFYFFHREWDKYMHIDLHFYARTDLQWACFKTFIQSESESCSEWSKISRNAAKKQKWHGFEKKTVKTVVPKSQVWSKLRELSKKSCLGEGNWDWSQDSSTPFLWEQAVAGRSPVHIHRRTRANVGLA